MIEIILLILTYTLLIISVFLQIVCYKRNIEFVETIAFTLSLLLLIIAISASSIIGYATEPESTNIFLLVSMILVGLTTPLNILKEREHNLSNVWNKSIIGASLCLLILTVVGFFSDKLVQLQYPVIAFLCISVVLSMILIRITKPNKRFLHREKIERTLAILFLVVVPLSLIAEYYLVSADQQFDIGFLLPLVFSVLAGSKIWDDLERLSLFKTKMEAKEQHLKNFALTGREQEIALCLAKGKTYKQVSEELHIAIPTVKTHVSNIYRKCGVKNKYELTALLIN